MTISQTFKKLAVGATLTAAMLGAAAPAMAGKDFIKEDLRNEESRVVQLVGQDLSHERLTLVVHGGNKNLMMSAYRAAQRLDDEGYSVAFLLAPDRDGIEISASVEFFTDGYTKFGATLYDNNKNHADSAEEVVYRQGLAAFNFAQQQNVKKSPAESITIASTSPD